MNRYFIHNSANDSNKLEVFHYLKNNFQSQTKIIINDISTLVGPDSEIFFFVPSSKITSIEIENSKKESEESAKAKLISDIDSYVVSDISENEIFIYRKNNLNLALLVEKTYLNLISNQLRLTGAKIYIYPEHFLAYAKNEMSILELFGRFIFSFGKGEGFSEYKENIKKYLELIKDSRKDFLPKLFSTDKEIIAFFKDSKPKDTNINLLHLDFLKSYLFFPNLYISGFHFEYWIKRYQINKFDISIAIAVITLLVIYPISATFLNNAYTEEYKDETIKLFKEINPNINRVVNPRRQIDEVITSYNLEQASQLSIAGLDSIKRLDIPEITKVDLDVNNSEAFLVVEKLAANKYKFLTNLMPQANIVLINEEIETIDGMVSGSILVGLGN